MIKSNTTEIYRINNDEWYITPRMSMQDILGNIYYELESGEPVLANDLTRYKDTGLIRAYPMEAYAGWSVYNKRTARCLWTLPFGKARIVDV